MISGNIQNFSHLSEFSTVKQFNATIKFIITKFGQQFTKSEQLALEQLTQFSVKMVGVCNARICKLVQAAQQKKGGISRSTFERMLRKAKQLGFLSVHHTIRKKGGYSHSVYVFHRIDIASWDQLTEREQVEKPITLPVSTPKKHPETSSLETNTKRKENRPLELEQLDFTYVPSYVPILFTNTVKPFYRTATEICQLWDRARIAYRSQRFTEPIDHFLPLITKAFKETVYQYKRKRIKTSFLAYYYGTVQGILAVEKRKQVSAQRNLNWLHE